MVRNIIFVLTLICFFSFAELVNIHASSDGTLESINSTGYLDDDDECDWDIDEDGVVDGIDLSMFITKKAGDDDDDDDEDDDDDDLAEFAAEFGRDDCPIDS